MFEKDSASQSGRAFRSIDCRYYSVFALHDPYRICVLRHYNLASTFLDVDRGFQGRVLRYMAPIQSIARYTSPPSSSIFHSIPCPYPAGGRPHRMRLSQCVAAHSGERSQDSRHIHAPPSLTTSPTVQRNICGDGEGIPPQPSLRHRQAEYS